MKKRAIKTFEAEPDVHEMLSAAQKSGLELKEIMNAACRECGDRVISRLASERLEGLHRLAGVKSAGKRSFQNPERQPAQELAA